MSVSLEIRFIGNSLAEPKNRDCVEHVCAVLRKELRAYAEAHGGDAHLGSPYATTRRVTTEGIGAAAAGESASAVSYVEHEARVAGSWTLGEP